MTSKICAGTVKGRFKLTAIRPDGTERVLADWFDNLIVDTGLNRMGSGAIGTWCFVGTGSTPPVVGDTAMQSIVASTSSQQETLAGQQASAPYFGWTRRRFRFATGAAAGNLAEVGIGWATGGTSLFSRALIVDGVGTPTTITVLSDEILDVTYELRLYPPLVDQTVDVVIAGVTYTTTIRASSVNASNWQPNGLLDYGARGPSNSLSMTPYAGPIGTILQAPSGTTGTNIAPGFFAYSNNSLKLAVTGTWTLDQGNIAGGGIGALVLLHAGYLGTFQFGFSAKIPKDNTKILTLSFEVSWARHTI